MPLTAENTQSIAGTRSVKNPPRRRVTLDKLTTDEIYSRIEALADSNPSMITARLRGLDAEIADAEKHLRACQQARAEELRAIDIDLADWNKNQLRKVGLRRVTAS